MSPVPQAFTFQPPAGPPSRVWVGAGVLDQLSRRWRPEWRQAAVVGDSQVMNIHGERVAALLRGQAGRVFTLEFSPGEAHKTRQTKEALEDELLRLGMDRTGCVVALGGGISLDMGGFVAATFMRGLPWVALPTSLLAQVDAAVGGKTGVNTPAGKNLVGAFHQPSDVLIDPDLLRTLPEAEWGNGLAELVKHAVVWHRGLFRRLEAEADLGTPGRLAPDLLAAAVAVKVEVVSLDEREQGPRAVLNFGHTVGHALEAATDHRLPHGAAVALGMIVEADAACRLCGFPTEERDRLAALLGALGVVPPRPALPFSDLERHLAVDKKRRGAEPLAALPRRLGEMAGATRGYTVPVPLELLRALWEGEA